jgi:hypothetical protein
MLKIPQKPMKWGGLIRSDTPVTHVRSAGSAFVWQGKRLAGDWIDSREGCLFGYGYIQWLETSKKYLNMVA